ncbi:MAG TPA: polysaccharide deacetylase family protein [Terriglobales bacterium]|nr:polysaccharide deacetylase family protein [Terriglobales bacterium]
MRLVSPALKHLVFPALSKSGYLRYWAGAGPGYWAGAGPAVVTYHGVFPSGYEIRNSALDGNLVHADALRRQFKLLQERYHVITPEEFLRWSELQWSEERNDDDGKDSREKHAAVRQSLPPRSILLTCDDALRNTLTEMVPILRDFGVSCLFFATGASTDATPSLLWYEELYLMLLDAAGPIGLNLPEAGISINIVSPRSKQLHAFWWNMVEKLSQFRGQARHEFLNRIRQQLRLSESWRSKFVEDSRLAARFLTLDRSGLQQLVAAGMSVGAHSLSHPILARASDDLAWQEISESKADLERALRRPVWAFGYPFGNAATVSRRDLKFAERAGFRCAFMNTGGGFGATNYRFAIPRVHVTADMGLPEFEANISGFYRSMRSRFSKKNNEEEELRLTS